MVGYEQDRKIDTPHLLGDHKVHQLATTKPVPMIWKDRRQRTFGPWPRGQERTRAQGVNQNLKEVEHMKPDIRASITLTREEPVYSGYRPAHLIGNYLTTGIHEYFNTNILKNGETVEGTITFISPEYYPHSLKMGMRLIFQEGSRITGYAEILEIYNVLLKA